MKFQLPFRAARLNALGLALSAVFSASLLLVAAPSHSATGATPAAKSSVAPVGKIPRTKDGKPDFSGIWETTSAAEFDLQAHSGRPDAPPGPGVVEGNDIPYLPKALEQKKKNFEARLKNDPRLKCITPGVPRSVYTREPFQIFQRARDLTLVHQTGYTVRTIHTNNTDHPAEPNNWWLGDSRGHWDGDTLVVDVRHFNDVTWLDRAGNFHSDALHVVERWTYLDANTLQYKARLEDEKVFSRPWDISVVLHRHREKNFQIIENYCYTHEYDDVYPPKPPAEPAR